MRARRSANKRAINSMENKLAGFMFQKTGINTLGKYLDVSAFRHKLISGNVANASTPGFRSRDIDFHAEFKRISGDTDRLVGNITHQSHIALGDHQEAPPDVQQARIQEGEMNAVDVDQEISGLAQNELLFTVGARLLKNKVDGIRKVITSK